MKPLKDILNIVDSHEHILLDSLSQTDKITETWNNCHFSSACILSAQGIGLVTQNIKCLLFKLKHPEIYAFGGLEHYQFSNSYCEPNYLEQIKIIDTLGFDGVKLIEGKPSVRKMLNKRLDDPIFDGFYNYAQANSMPITYHVADPQTFWDINTVPDWAIQEGWYYGEDGYIPYSQFYEETEGILKKFPNLKLILAHFFFLSDNISEARRFLDTYPNISLDLTPGVEMYYNFAENIYDWKDFFHDYQDRIIFGTDKTDEDIENLTNAYLPRKFLELDSEFEVYDIRIKGLGLDNNILQKIYSDNFLRMVGDKPNQVDVEEAVRECSRVSKYIEHLELLDLSYFDRLLYQDKDRAYKELNEIKEELILWLKTDK